MSVISWGKPTVEVADSVDKAPGTEFTAFPIIKEGTATLTTTKGTQIEATGEGNERVDIRFAPNTYSFSFEVFVKKGDATRTLDAVDGTITGDKTIRLTPEDPTNEGFIIDCARATVDETWTSADGKTLTYTFEGIKPATGNVVKPYTATAEP